MLKKVVSDVKTEPQQVDGEILDGLTGINSKPDIRTIGVWRDLQNADCDIRVTNTIFASQCHDNWLDFRETWKRKK